MLFSLARYDTVTTTMDVAREEAERGAPEGTVVTADMQSAGRGRSSHAWYSPPGQSLYLSILLRPSLAPGEAGWITMVAALAAREVVDGEIQKRLSTWRNIEARLSLPPSIRLLPVTIKWFNDVHLNGRKVCGILFETSFTGARLDYGILGIGLNVNTRFDGAPADVQARATSLAHEFTRIDERAPADPFDREEMLQQLLARFGERYANLIRTRQSPAREYAQYVETLGRDIRVDDGREIVSGRAARIGEDGALIIETACGERRINFGDVL